MRIRTIRRTFIPQHIEQFSCTRGGNFQYLPDIKFMRTRTEPSCVSPRIPVRKKSLYELLFLLPPSPSLPVIHLQVFPFSLGESARRKKVFFGRQIGFFFSCGARVFAYRVQILDGCSDRFSQRREVYASVSFAGAWKRIRNSSHARWNCSALTG